MYLNRTYAYFYDFQGSHFIGNPSYSSPKLFQTSPQFQTKKLVILGDSLMAGTGSTDEKNSLAILIAQDLAKQENIELINLASPGVGIEDVFNRQLPMTFKEKPDYIILMIGINDMHNKKSEFFFRTYYGMIIHDLKNQTDAKITLINIPYLGSDKILLPPWNFIMDLQIRKFNEVISSVGSDSNLPVMDLYSQFKSQFKKSSDLYASDQFHPSDKGYKLWGDYIISKKVFD